MSKRERGPGQQGWRPIETAPKDEFVIVWAADKSRWLAKWQADDWYGIDDYGLARNASRERTEILLWQPLPEPPQ